MWLRAQAMHLGKGVAASGPLATRLGLSGVPVAAGRIVGLGRAPAYFAPTHTIDASGCIVLPGLVDLASLLL